MITGIILTIWFFLIIIPLICTEYDINWPWAFWLLLSVFWIVPIFTGFHVENNEGQYKGYIVSVEKNGAIFQGYNAYLKTDLTSSNEDIACIDRNNPTLIEKLKLAQEKKENLTLIYRGVWQFAIGECPGADWMITGIK